MTNEEAINTLKSLKDYYNDKNEDSYVGFDDEDNEALDNAIKALEQQPKPMEKFDDVKTHIQRLAGDYKCWDNRLTWEEALELNRMLEAQPTEAVSREAVEEITFQEPSYTDPYNILTEVREKVRALSSVTPERPKGKWNFIGDQMFECSSCKRTYTQNQFEELRIYTTDDLLPKFCPNCGSYNGGNDNGDE